MINDNNFNMNFETSAYFPDQVLTKNSPCLPKYGNFSQILGTESSLFSLFPCNVMLLSLHSLALSFLMGKFLTLVGKPFQDIKRLILLI